MSAWEEVKPEVVTTCFKHVGMYSDKRREDIEIDDHFACKQELGMETLLSKIFTSRQDLGMSSFAL